MRPPLFTFLGICFALIGGFTVFDILLNLVLVLNVAPLSLSYAALDFLLAFALLRPQRWLLWALVANWVGFACLVALNALHGAYAPAATVGFLINTAVLLSAAYYRTKLVGENWYAAGAFAALWALNMGYTIYKFF